MAATTQQGYRFTQDKVEIQKVAQPEGELGIRASVIPGQRLGHKPLLLGPHSAVYSLLTGFLDLEPQPKTDSFPSQ